MDASISEQESARLAALQQYQILDTAPEDAFDDLVRLAAQLCGTPIALINLIDRDRQWFKAKVGLDLSEIPREIGLCHLCLQQRDGVVIPDTLADTRVNTNPVVTAHPYVRFYAGVPLLTPQQELLGTLCVIDQVPRELMPDQLTALQALGRQVVNQLELRRHISELSQRSSDRLQLLQREQQARSDAEAARHRSIQILERITDAFLALNHEWQFIYINPQAELLLRRCREDLIGRCLWDEFPEAVGSIFDWEYHKAVNDQESVTFTAFYPPLETWFEVHAYPSPEGLSVYFQDINERIQSEADRQQAEATLRQSEATLRSFFDSAPLMMGIVELREHDILHIADNAITAKAFGVAPATMHHWLESEQGIPPEHVQLWLQHYREAEYTQAPVHFEQIYTTTEGAKWLAVTVSVIPGEQGQQPRFAYVAKDISDAKRDEAAREHIEQELRESAEHFRILVTYVPVGIFQTDAQGNCIFVNHKWLELTGLSLAQALGTGWRNALHPEDRERVFQEWQQVAHTGHEFSMEYRFQTPHGRVNWVFGRAIAVRDEAGTMTGYFGTVTDITERKRVEAALRDSEERWQLAIHGNNDGIWDWNVQTNEVFFAPRWKEMLGYADHEIANHVDEWAKRVHPDDLGWVTQAIQDHFAQKTPFYITEHRVQCKDGSYKWILDRGQALWDDAGNVVRMVGSHTDISDRKQAEAELLWQSQRSQLLAEITLKIRQSLQLDEILQTTVAEVRQILQADRVVVYRVWANGTGSTIAEAVLPGWPALLEMSFPEEVFPPNYQELYRQGRVRAIPDVTAADAGLTPCLVEFVESWAVQAKLIVPVILKEKLWGLLIAHQCCAPRQWSDFEIELLQQLANQLSIALSQVQLLEAAVQQRQELVRSNADLEQFAYVASHDLQEPLRMVTSYLQLLERRYKGKLDTTADEFIAYAVDGADRMRILINDLLSYSRVSTRGQPFQRVDGEAILQRAIANLQLTIAETAAIITHDPLPELMVDGTQLTQVFQNLLSNAIKFRRDLPPQIHIGATHKGGEGESQGEWWFWVRDNGIGIEPGYGDRIFLIFQRLHSRSVYPGSGIGLAICKKIIERHGGRIWIESQPGQGTTFYFTLPDHTGIP
jgi:PAS domain S-box-containing protein